MEITYLGHSSFKLKGKPGVVVTDPFNEYVGFNLPSTSADVVTVSHQHPDHNAVENIKGTARREKPFVITQPGDYEVGGISVFGVVSFHDDNKGTERGGNTIFTIMIDEVRICHLGDLGHELTPEQISDIGPVDVLLCPVGGVFTLTPSQAVKAIHALDPSYVIPMHYKTPQHKEEVFGELSTLDDFLKAYGADVTPVEKLSVEKGNLPEETELVLLASYA